MESPNNTPAYLSADAYDEIFYMMVDQGTYWAGRTALISFTDQIAHITSPGDPECYLFTAKSAIPVADAVRGYYDTLGKPHPILGIIEVNASIVNPWKRQAFIKTESARLQPLIGELGRVSVVEQFVSTGCTLSLAKKIVRSKNPQIKTQNFAASNWYHDAHESDIDFSNVSSVHADFMYGVGIAAAEKVLAGNYNDVSELGLVT